MDPELLREALARVPADTAENAPADSADSDDLGGSAEEAAAVPRPATVGGDFPGLSAAVEEG